MSREELNVVYHDLFVYLDRFANIERLKRIPFERTEVWQEKMASVNGILSLREQQFLSSKSYMINVRKEEKKKKVGKCWLNHTNRLEYDLW